MKGDRLTKMKAIKLMSRVASMLKVMNKSEISFREFEEKYQSRKKFLQTFKTALKRYASHPIKFLDPEGEILVYVDIKRKCFNIRRLRE